VKKIILTAIIASMLLASPVLAAELDDYQKGVASGLAIGLYMGKLQQPSAYSPDLANEYNSQVEKFNAFLQQVFANNQTMIDKFKLQPVVIQSPRVAVVGKRVHAIDASFNQTPLQPPLPDANGRIGEYPADAYYTATGNWPSANVDGGLQAP
jgi:hypothetical protein